MCGIAGIIGRDASENILNQLLLPIAHRGEVSYRNEKLVLSDMAIGTHRLAIVDEFSGKQPICIEDEHLFCVFNGEIYNHSELRQLLSIDKSFLSECDSEVVLRAFLKWKEEFVKYLDGKYAIAVFDKGKNELILARDPMGIKPLYYAHYKDAWVFSSELKSLAVLKDNVHNIIELPPGSIWKSGKQITYFNLKNFSKSQLGNLSEYSLNLKNYIVKAVRKRIPENATRIACLLSGGIDSSIITYVAKQLHPKVVAYTLAAPQMPSEDLTAAKILCELADIEHVIVSPSVQEMQKFYLEQGVYMTESFEPVLVRNAVSYHFLCRQAAADGFKYCLNGEGADELFGGYDFIKEAPVHLQDDVIWHSLSIIHKTYLQMADRASMYATLEARVPYMDKDLIDFCLSLPPKARIDGNDNKVLLRQAFRDELPKNIVTRRKTGMNEGAGFGINATKDSIYYKAVQSYYEQHPSKLEEDISLCKKVAMEGKIDLTEIEELYNFARFIKLNYIKLVGSQNRLQLNTKLKQKLVKPLLEQYHN